MGICIGSRNPRKKAAPFLRRVPTAVAVIQGPWLAVAWPGLSAGAFPPALTNRATRNDWALGDNRHGIPEEDTMYTAHYQGTAQVAVIAGLPESSGLLKAQRRNFRARIFSRAAVMVSGQPCGSAPDSTLKRRAGAESASISAGQVTTLSHLQCICCPGFQHSPDCERIRDLTLFRQS